MPPTTPTLLRSTSSPRPAGDSPPSGGGAGNGNGPKLKKLRLGFILLGLSLLATVSTLFGMLMAVSSDLPALENQTEFRKAKNSVLIADNKQSSEIAKLTGNQNRILVDESEISPNIKNAVIAIEDVRFYDHEGVDYRGILRALGQDLLQQKAAQGGSTITQQFVKNALVAQGNRSVLQKLRESSLAYHLERKWSKQKILTQYLNSIYFGNGAYGIESAVRTYFGRNRVDSAPSTDDASPTGDSSEDEPTTDVDAREALSVSPAEAALLAGIIASPTGYDPVQNPRSAKTRRDVVLGRMLEEKMISRVQYEDAVREALPSEDEVNPPRPDSDQPYYSSWLTQQLVDRYGSGRVFGGGLKIKTTLDPELQTAAEEAISGSLSGVGPSASLVAIENKTGEIKAMVGGTDFDKRPFNIATAGHRQPGSAFKPFTLLTALGQGVSPDQTFESRRKELPVESSDKNERFVVNNYEDQYSGVASLSQATAQSDNSVFAELGLDVGTKKIARLAEKMGIRTDVSTNPAMTLGGLKEGLTPLEMAYAYSTIANKGVRVSGTLAAEKGGPVAFQEVKGDGTDDKNDRRAKRVFPEEVGESAQQLLAGVIQGGTGKNAAVGEFAAGKTGTTENYGDAWFAGFNKELTIAVWVGYPEGLKPMLTEYGGQAVAGGTYPTDIWRKVMEAWIALRDERNPDEDSEDAPVQTAPAAPVAPEQQTPVEPQQTAPAEQAPPQQAPQQQVPQQQAPPPQTPQTPAGGGGGAQVGR
ncbi:MAG: transglycosylase domain-containing protein [Thermoleophilaceae bacterium]